VRLYPVGTLLETATPDRPLHLGIERRSPFGLPVPEVDPTPRTLCLDGNTLTSLLVASLDAAGPDAAATEFDVRGETLLVLSTDAGQRVVREVLDGLRSNAGRRVGLTIHRLTFDAEVRARLQAGGWEEKLDRGRLTAEEVPALLSLAEGAGVRRSSASTRVPEGVASRFGRVTSITYVGDYDIEIAQDSRVGNPVVQVLHTGTDACLAAFPLRDGRVGLEGTVQLASPKGRMRRLPLDVEPLGAVELPRCDVLRFSTAASVAPGEAAVWTSGGDAPDPLEILLVVAQPDASAEAGPGVRFYPAPALALPRWGWRLARPEDDDTGFVPPVLALAVEDDEAWDLFDLVGPLVSGPDWEGPDNLFEALPSGIVARNAPAVLDALSRKLAALETERRPCVPVRFRVLRVGEDGSERVAHAITTHVPLGADAAWMAGTEVAYLADWSVEVAQEARAGDPTVDVAFTGTAVSLRLDTTAPSSRYALRLSVSYATPGDWVTRNPGNDETGPIDSPQVHTVVGRLDTVVAAGRATRIPVGREEDGTRVVAEVRVGP
jgi:hypothetical protein